MKRTFFWLWALCAGAAFLPDRAAAAWYWPFGYDEDGTNQPPRLHRLLEKANDYIELAEDESLNGNGDKAIENYKLALAELDRVEEENPDRAETTEFAPLRNRRAACTAAIDTIRFAQINENERAVAVSNTTELQKKWNKKHGIKNPDDPADDADAPAKKEDAQKGADATATDKKSDKAPTAATVQTSAVPFATRLKAAYDEVRNKNYRAADLLLADLQKEQPDDLNVLLLRAAAQSGAGSNFAARRTLERAIRKHPKSYLPCYNLAYLLLKMGEDAESARDYYEMGRDAGGPEDKALEQKIKDKETKR